MYTRQSVCRMMGDVSLSDTSQSVRSSQQRKDTDEQEEKKVQCRMSSTAGFTTRTGCVV